MSVHPHYVDIGNAVVHLQGILWVSREDKVTVQKHNEPPVEVFDLEVHYRVKDLHQRYKYREGRDRYYDAVKAAMLRRNPPRND